MQLKWEMFVLFLFNKLSQTLKKNSSSECWVTVLGSVILSMLVYSSLSVSSCAGEYSAELVTESPSSVSPCLLILFKPIKLSLLIHFPPCFVLHDVRAKAGVELSRQNFQKSLSHFGT